NQEKTGEHNTQTRQGGRQANAPSSQPKNLNKRNEGIDISRQFPVAKRLDLNGPGHYVFFAPRLQKSVRGIPQRCLISVELRGHSSELKKANHSSQDQRAAQEEKTVPV